MVICMQMLSLSHQTILYMLPTSVDLVVKLQKKNFFV
jgi:hypothetical protein